MKKNPIILKPGQLSGSVDTQYAGSRLGDYSASWITGVVTQIMNEQQARLGRFLTYKQKLFNLAQRASTIRDANTTQGTSLLGRVTAAQSNQALLESRGFELIRTIAAVQSNPIVKLLTNEDLNQKDLSTDLVQRGETLIASLRTALTQSTSLNNEITRHEKTVTQIEKDTDSIEGELAGRGLFNKAGKGLTSLLAAPTALLKYGAVIAGVGAAIYFLPGMLKKKR